MKSKTDQELLDEVVKNRATRRLVTMHSHPMFFSVYFPNYLRYPTAEFQRQIIQITEDRDNRLACIVAFRGSGKSTLVTFSYSLWAILGIQQKKFVLIICQTQAQAKQHMANLKHELEQNRLLKSDLGPFREEIGNAEWAMSSLVFQNTGARITIASIDQSIRGIRHHEHRPDLIILDDIEDLNSTKTMEGRNKTFDWFTREIVPLGDIGTRIIIVGNLLHEDSLLMRLKRKIMNKEISGVYHEFPLIDDSGNCLWKEKFDTPDKIETLRKSVANESAWQQEYLLKIINDQTRVIHSNWIHYYDVLPADTKDRYNQVTIGVDLAISLKETADYTAIVTVVIYGSGDDLKFYVLPNPVNKRLGFPEAIESIRLAVKTCIYSNVQIVIEANGFQEIYADQLRNYALDVKSVKNTTDKRSRLALTSHYIKNGQVLFPRVETENLIAQLTGFGIENHDDLCDAFAIAIIDAIQEYGSQPDIHIINHKPKRSHWYFPGDESDPIDYDLCY